MKQIRLLPVVITAALALLVLKGFGIMTGGGYVLTGTTQVQAAGAAPAKPASSGAAAPELSMAVEPTMSDGNPVLDDGAPTLAMPAAPSGHSDAADGAGEAGHDGEAAAATSEGVPEGQGGATGEETAAASACPPGATAGPPGSGFNFMVDGQNCNIDPGVNEGGDALPLIRNEAGNLVPLAEADGVVASEDAILERLSERRQELDVLQSELDMRLALVEAAEKRIEERTAALEVLEGRIEAMVDEKRALEETQFVSVVAMYETMKPKDAAAIFDQLEMPVLLRVSRAINPRKMAPIMARMDPVKAKDLTAGLAVDQVEPTIDMSDQENLAALPKIIGQ